LPAVGDLQHCLWHLGRRPKMPGMVPAHGAAHGQ
jgi:hypothetical protein